MKTDPELWQHKEWLGLLQPVGLVVSPLALVKHQAFVNRSEAIAVQQKLTEIVSTSAVTGRIEEGKPWIEDFAIFAEKVLDWLPEDLVGTPGQKPLPVELEVPLPDYGEILKPTYGVADPDGGEWVLLVKTVEAGLSLDEVYPPDNEKGNGWKATIQAKFERLLRETQIPIGLLTNGTEIRLVYAPRGESSGHLTFPVQAMTEVAGRSILGALQMLIGSARLFEVQSDRRLGRILSSSRDYQAEVSTKLADQVLDALWELLRGFQSANAASDGSLFAPLALNGRGARGEGNLALDENKSPLTPLKKEEIYKEGAKHIYGGLITTLMRLVFLLYAEDEGLMPDDAIYQQNYSVSGLYERLREDMSNYPDTMDMRYGAWAWILSLFRLVYDGGGALPEYLPARHGQLFDPDEYPFLEGRTNIPLAFDGRGARGEGDKTLNPPIPNPSPTRVEGSKIQNYQPNIPRISDGVIYRLLDKLLMLDGERLSYRALDVEQIGSVYEAIMGYEVEVAVNPSIGVKSKPKGSKISTTVVVDVQALLEAKAGDRDKLLKDWAECELKGNSLKALKSAETIEEIVAALDRKVSERTPNLLPKGSLYLQPGEERRRTGSHYTPRKLTQPIVENTLRPIFEQLGEHPTPEQILSLKICDLAMGSAAFLVEACRQLADNLVEAWDYHGLESASTLNSTLSKEKGMSSSPPAPLLSKERGVGSQDYWEIPETLRKKMIEVARDFRKQPTPSEAIMWQSLRERKLEGLKFRRQQPIGNFVVDFFCAEQRLIVEIDGGIHEAQKDLDRQRQELLESLGLRFVRIPSERVEQDLPQALQIIKNSLTSSTIAPLALDGRGTALNTSQPFPQKGRRESDITPHLHPHKGGREIPQNIEPLLYARRLVAQRCLYGVDKNPFAVNLAKLSLWLVTLAKDLPFTFVDHALKCGDSLVGLTRAEIGSFGKDSTQDLPLMKLLKEKIDKAKSYRDEIQSVDTQTDEDAEIKLQQWRQAEMQLEEARLIGDVKVAAFFSGSKTKEREEKLSEYAEVVRHWRASQLSFSPHSQSLPQEGEQSMNTPHPQPFPHKEGRESEIPLAFDGRGVRGEGEIDHPVYNIANSLRQTEKPITPFNWELEFPEVFERDNPGFDAIIGNPPFAGKNTTINSNPEGYLDWLKIVHPEAHGNSDLVAHFFRRAFTIIRQHGTFGLIATNTIAQGDTRTTGLRFICNNGATIYNADKRVKWQGAAAVVVSVVNVFKGDYQGRKTIGGRETDKITAFLFHAGGNEDPEKLKANQNKSFQGSIVLGMGFTFDDSNPDATPIAEMHRLIEQNPKNAEVIFPYIGGEEVNSNPDHSHYRYAIDFFDRPEEECWRDYPDLMAIIKEKVKPDRDKQKRDALRVRWWQYAEKRPGLKKAIAPLDRVLVMSVLVHNTYPLLFYLLKLVFSNTLICISIRQLFSFCCPSIKIHEVWARFFGSSLEDRLTLYSYQTALKPSLFPILLIPPIPSPSPTRVEGSLIIFPSPSMGEGLGVRVTMPSMGEGLGVRVIIPLMADKPEVKLN